MTLRLHKKHPTTVPTNLEKEVKHRIANLPFGHLVELGRNRLRFIVLGGFLLQATLATPGLAEEAVFRKPSTHKTAVGKGSKQPARNVNPKPSWSASKRLDNSSNHLPWSKPSRSIAEQIHKHVPSYVDSPRKLKRIDAPSSVSDTGSLQKVTHYEFANAPAQEVRVPRAKRRKPQPAQRKIATAPRRKITTINQPANSPKRRTSSVARQFQRNPQFVAMQAQAADDDSLDMVFDNELDDLDTSIPDEDATELTDPDLDLDDASLDDLMMEEEQSEAAPADREATVDDFDALSPDEILDDSSDLDTTDDDSNAFTDDDYQTDLFDDTEVEDSDETVEPPVDTPPADAPPVVEPEETTESPESLFSQEDDGNEAREVPPAEEESVRPPRDMEADDPFESDVPDLIDLNVFDGRNCPEDLAVYKRAWQLLENRSLADISLDITPDYEPNIDDKTEADQIMKERLSNSPTRDWYNRVGRLVATGKLENFHDGNVMIRNDEGIQTVKYQELSNADMCVVGAWWQLPTEYIPDVEPFKVRNWTSLTFTWKASGLCHKPLYFEEVQLERYGHSAGPAKQTFLSGAHFFGSIFFLPYKIGLNPPNECQYDLGYYRPGNCAPWLLHAVPLSSRAARMQLGAITGGIGVVP